MRLLLFLAALCSGCDESVAHAFRRIFAGGDGCTATTPVMGSSTFYHFSTAFNATDVTSIADGLVSNGLRDVGYNIVRIDEGWPVPGVMGVPRPPGSHQIPDPTKFPAGLGPVFAHITSLGMRPGQYTDAGFQSCDGLWYGSGWPDGGPEDANFFSIDANDFASQGTAQVFLDGCNLWVDAGSGQTMEAAYQLAYAGFSAALAGTVTGPNTQQFLSESAPAYFQDTPEQWYDILGNWIFLYGQTWRTGRDLGVPLLLTGVAAGSDGVALPQATINVGTTAAFPGGVENIAVYTTGGYQTVSCTGLTGTSFTGCTGGAGTMMLGNPVTNIPNRWNNGVAGVLENYQYNRWLARFSDPNRGWNDADMLLIGDPGLTDDESRSQMSLWAIMSAPLVIGADPAYLSTTPLSILKNSDALTIDQTGRQAYVVLINGANGEDVLLKHMSGNEYAFVILNSTAGPITATVTGAQLGFGSNFDWHEVWTNTSGVNASSVTITLASHATGLYRVTMTGALTPTGILENAANDVRGILCAEWDGAGFDQFLRMRACSGIAFERLQLKADETIHLINPQAPFNDQCLDYDASSPAKALLAPCSGLLRQQWIYTRVGNLINAQTGNCLDSVAFGGDGAPLTVIPCAWNGGEQIWSAPFPQ